MRENIKVKQVTPQQFCARQRNRLIFAFAMTLVLSIVSQWVFVPHGHPYFAMDGEYWFYPAAGILSGVILILVSRFLGLILKRHETYWGEEEKD